jgi:hypothetical protein
MLAIAPEGTRFTIVAVNDAFLEATMATRDELLGGALFEVFPDNPDDPSADGSTNLRASFHRVLTTRRSDGMAVQRYDIQRRQTVVREFEERHWLPHNTPVIEAGGIAVTHILHRVEDVTHLVPAGRSRDSGTMRVRCRVRVSAIEDLPHLRAAVRDVAEGRGFEVAPLVDLLVVVSELGRDMIVRAGAGTVDVEVLRRAGSRQGLRLTFRDEGPELAPLPEGAAMASVVEGVMGQGRTGRRALVDELDAKVGVGGSGVVVVVTKWGRT